MVLESVLDMRVFMCVLAYNNYNNVFLIWLTLTDYGIDRGDWIRKEYPVGTVSR